MYKYADDAIVFELSERKDASAMQKSGRVNDYTCYIWQYRNYTESCIKLYFPGVGFAEIRCVKLCTIN